MRSSFSRNFITFLVILLAVNFAGSAADRKNKKGGRS